MKNLFISNLHKKNVSHCTTNIGLLIRKKTDKPFKKLCNVFTHANIIRQDNGKNKTDDEYFSSMDTSYIPESNYEVKEGKNNIVVERYPELNKDEPYIFVCNHTCPEDIETVLNIIDRNAYLILGSIESLQYNPEMYLSFLNGMIPFDILDTEQRELVKEKMARVLKTNSILIFPEGSHNYNPNKIINNLFDGPINLAINTNRKIVIITMLKDFEKNISYIDVSNPIDVSEIPVDMNREFKDDDDIIKYIVNSMTLVIRDKMATAAYHIMVRHFKTLKRTPDDNLEEKLRMENIEDAFKKLKWDHDVFEAEYLTKKSHAEQAHEEVVRTMSNLAINPKACEIINGRDWIIESCDLENKDIVHRMREHLQEEKVKVLTKKKK